jgi:hypothetical protein
MVTEAFALRNHLLSGSDASIEAVSGRLGMNKCRLASLISRRIETGLGFAARKPPGDPKMRQRPAPETAPISASTRVRHGRAACPAAHHGPAAVSGGLEESGINLSGAISWLTFSRAEQPT